MLLFYWGFFASVTVQTLYGNKFVSSDNQESQMIL